MQKFLSFLLFFFPHPLNGATRRLLGQKVSKKAKIQVFSFIQCRDLVVSDNSLISSFTILRANTLSIGSHSHIAALTVINAPLISGADFKMGDHSRIFPFCWLEPGEGIFIGNHVGIGGHTLIFTHGVWSNYLLGGPVSYGSVTIEDHVWLPWRVFIMPNVRIGSHCIIGAGSIVTKNIPAHSLAAGQPAKIIKENLFADLTQEVFQERSKTVVDAYFTYCKRAGRNSVLSPTEISFKKGLFETNSSGSLLVDLDTDSISGSHAELQDFQMFLRRYGIRVSA